MTLPSQIDALRTLANTLRNGPFQALAVHWDMDGTLVDSEPLHVEKLIRVSARHGVALTPAHFTTPQTFLVPDGPGGQRSVTMVLHGAGDKNIYWWLLAQRPLLRDVLPQQAWLDELMDYYLANAGSLAPRESVDTVVQALHSVQALQSIVTSATAPQLLVCSNALRGIHPCLAFVLSANDVKRSKPEPEGYLTARARADAHWAVRGVTADRVFQVAVEDSPTGVRAALAAGLPCVHYLLPGQQPFGAGPGQRLAVARSSAELLAAILRLMLEQG